MSDPADDEEARRWDEALRGDEARRWDETARRVALQLEHGPRVRGISNQLSLLLLVAVLGAVQVVGTIGSPATPRVVIQYALLLAALAFTASGYGHARRAGRLMPQIPVPRADRALATLLPSERQELVRQMRGKEPPTSRTAPVLRDLVRTGQRNNSSVYRSLVGFFLYLLSNAVFLGWPWPLVVAGLLLFLLVLARIERRRWQRLLASVDAVG